VWDRSENDGTVIESKQALALALLRPALRVIVRQGRTRAVRESNARPTD
jgi:hypothetical protein